MSPQEAAGLSSELSWVDSQRVPGGQFDYTPWQQLKDGASSQVDSATRGAQQLGQDLLNLPHDLLTHVPRIPSDVQQGDANPLVDVTNGGSGTPPTPAVVTSTTLMTPEGPVPGPSVAIPGSPGYVPTTATVSSGNDNSGASSSSNGASSSSGSPKISEVMSGCILTEVLEHRTGSLRVFRAILRQAQRLRRNLRISFGAMGSTLLAKK